MNQLSIKPASLSIIALLILMLACGGSAPETIPTEETIVESTESPVTEATESPATEEVSNEPLGSSLKNPLSLTEKLVTPEWEVQVLEVLRGDEVTAKVDDASHEDANMEYMLVNLRVKYVGANPSAYVYGKMFRSIGNAGEIYDAVSFLDIKVPTPELEADLTTGSETEGWVAIQVAKDETDILLVFWQYVWYENDTAMFSDGTPKWYISLE